MLRLVYRCCVTSRHYDIIILNKTCPTYQPVNRKYLHNEVSGISIRALFVISFLDYGEWKNYSISVVERYYNY